MKNIGKKWKVRPGGWDRLNTRAALFDQANDQGFPTIPGMKKKLDEARPLIRYTERDDRGKRIAQGLCHFFLDDYRLESSWNRPTVCLGRVKKFWAALTPDFGIYPDWPLVVQQWNCYRSRWMGCYWAMHGVNVIPTVNWSDLRSYSWCFLGLPVYSTVAISVPDVRKKDVFDRFEAGYREMIKKINPQTVLVYGKMPFKSERCVEYEPAWKSLASICSNKTQEQYAEAS